MTQPTPSDQGAPEPRRSFFVRARGNFLTGLVVVLPVGLTLWLIWTVTGWIDGWVLPLVPDAYQPEGFVNRLLGNEPGSPDWVTIQIRGVGVVIFLIFTVLVGWVMKGLIGRSLLKTAEQLVDRMPVVRSVYNGLKQIAETVFAQSDTSFQKACLIEYPRPGIWALGFISTPARGEVAARVPTGEEVLSVFLPTTPNPTSGFLLFLPRSAVIELDMSVEDAAKLIISAGLVYPNGKEAKAAVESAAAARKSNPQAGSDSSPES